MSQALAKTRSLAEGQPVVLDAEIAGQLFDLIGQSDLISRGLALLVSIAPVKRALGERWPQRREQIYSLADRYLQKHLSPHDVCRRTDEVHFLVATPFLTPVAAQATCYRALIDVLAYLIGQANPDELEVTQVAELSADRIRLRRFSLDELREADAKAPRPAETSAPPRRARSETPAETPLASLASWPLRAADGRDLRVSFAVDPVFDLKAWAMAGHRIESRIVSMQTEVELTAPQRRNLLPRDFERIDLAALERGLSRLEGVESFDRPRLIIQLSFASLSNGRARAALLDRARELQHVLRHAAICELVDVEPGVPVGRLTDVTSLIRGFFRGVWVQVEPSRVTIEAALAAKASGLTIRADDLGQAPDQIAEGLRSFMGLIKRRNVLLTVTSLPTADLMIDAMMAGFTHSTLRARRDADGRDQDKVEPAPDA
jgi:hypothetical protein